jgi:hypothetical protein
METYIGTKIIKAEPMTRGAYNEYRGWTIPENENPNDDGFLVEYSDSYVSWSPAHAFNEAYRPMSGLTFGLAIEAAKKGHKIARKGWNGKGLYVIYRTGYPDGIPCNKNTADAVGIPEGTLFKVRPYLQMKCVDDSFQMWLASQSDILESDWEVVE